MFLVPVAHFTLPHRHVAVRISHKQAKATRAELDDHRLSLVMSNVNVFYLKW